MAISNRPALPNLEAFINKGGSSTASEENVSVVETTMAPPVDKAKRATKPNTRTSAPTPSAKPKGRPRKAAQVEALKFLMRVPPEIAAELDRSIERMKIPVSRNAWILEAILQRLEQGK